MTRRARTALAAALTLLALFAGVTAGYAQQQVRTRAGAHEGFGRIVFDWPQAKVEKVEVADGKLHLQFAEPFVSDYDAVLRHLFRYISKVEASPDQRTLELTLLQPVEVRVKTIGKVLAVDLVASTAAGDEGEAKSAKAVAAKPDTAAPADKAADKKDAARAEKTEAAATPVPAAKPAEAKPTPAKPAEKVRVRAGEHATYSRFVVEWQRDVTYRVRRDGDAVTITFDRPAELEVQALTADPPRHLRGVSSAVADAKTVLRLTTMPHARYRHFRSGTGVVLDLLDPPASVLRRQERRRKEEAARQAAQADSAEADKAPEAKPGEAPEPPVSLLPKADNGAAETAAGSAAPTPAGAGSPAAQAAPDPLRYRQPTRTLALGGGPDLKAEAAIYDDGLVLNFTWPEPVAAAVFLRAGFLWVTFERPATLRFDGLESSSGILQAHQIANRDATILRLALRDGLYPQVQRDEARWSVRLLPGSGQPQQALAAAIQQSDDGSGRVFLPVVDTGAKQIIYDPEVGDEIVLVPLLGSGAGVVAQRDFVDFRLLPTAQGILVRPNTDDLQVKALRNGVEIAASKGLALSSSESRARAGGDPAGVKYKASLKPPLLLFKDWRGEGESFDDRRHALQLALARAPRAGRNVARLELAKFYLANGLAPEALALLRLIEEDDGGVTEDPLFRAMRGVANLQLHRLEAAQADLSYHRLKLFPDIALWQGSLLTKLGRYEEASRRFALGVGTLSLLDAPYRDRLTLDWAVATARGGADGEFRTAADQLATMPSTPKSEATLAYLNGLRAQDLEQIDDALESYQAAIDTHYRPIRALAALQKTDLELKQGRLEAAEALDTLERLRFAWRGDQYELDVIAAMVDLQLDQDAYGAALMLLRTAVSNFPESATTQAMAQQMNEVFATLFLDGAADDLHPVTALALYYEFQELTPLGKDGDKMIQRLADRLVDVDLLDRAAGLLTHQVQYRLKGQEKVRVGTRLAVIHLLDGKAREALQALDATEVAGLSDGIADQRRHLRARALAELDRVDEALELLADDDSGAADQLKADIFWRSQRWADAAGANEALLGERWQEEAPLNEVEQAQVIQLTVSFYMAGDDDSLDRVRQQYAGKITDGPMADTFRVLTHRVDPASIEFRKLAKEIAAVADLESFMSSYRDRMKRGGLSALN